MFASMQQLSAKDNTMLGDPTMEKTNDCAFVWPSPLPQPQDMHAFATVIHSVQSSRVWLGLVGETKCKEINFASKKNVLELFSGEP